MFPKLFRKEVQDAFVQENFVRIQDYFTASDLERCSFKFYEIPWPPPELEDLVVFSYPYRIAFPHGLKFVPKDVVALSSNPSATTVTWHYEDFDETYVYATVSAAVTLRVLLGRYA